MATPSVGRSVHYVAHGTPVRPDGTQAYASACRAAIITEVMTNDGVVGLAVFNPTGMFFHSADHDESALAGARPKGGTWHWPERVI